LLFHSPSLLPFLCLPSPWVDISLIANLHTQATVTVSSIPGGVIRRPRRTLTRPQLCFFPSLFCRGAGIADIYTPPHERYGDTTGWRYTQRAKHDPDSTARSTGAPWGFGRMATTSQRRHRYSRWPQGRDSDTSGVQVDRAS